MLYGGYSTISLGYLGIYEMTKLMKGVSHTTLEGHDFSIKVMQYMNDKILKWRKETNIDFVLYAIPDKELCYNFAKIDKEKFGTIENITEKGYYTNSYHIDSKEKIDIFEKLKIESEFQKLSGGGAISYVDISSIKNDNNKLETLIKYVYNNIQYVEFKI